MFGLVTRATQEGHPLRLRIVLMVDLGLFGAAAFARFTQDFASLDQCTRAFARYELPLTIWCP